MELCRYHRKLLSSKNASSDRDDARPKTTPSVHVHPGKTNEKDIIATGMTVLGCVVGVALLLCILYLALAFCRQRNGRRRTTTTSAPIVSGPLAHFSDELQSSEEPDDHPIWYINTIGLSQSLIDSISLFKYEKDQGVIDGTECSVCLNEFQEDDTLRLLPKCSHAFHLPCIDTWLRSHKTCPLCRAPLVSDSFNDQQVAPSQPTTTDLDARTDSQMEIDHGDDNDCLPIEDGMDLVDSLQEVLDEAQKQPMRRSVSLDSSSTLAINNVMANITPGSSDSMLEKPKCWKWKNSYKCGNTGFHKYAVSDLQKLPIITMKRSASSSEKFSLSRQNKNKESGCSF